MSWVATLVSVGAEGSNPNVLATILLTNSVTGETQNRTLVGIKLTMGDITAFAINNIAQLDQRDKVMASFQQVNDAIGAGKGLVLAKSAADLTAADAV